MKKFLKSAKRNLLNERPKAEAAIEALFDVAEINLLKEHDDITPTFCHDVVLVVMVVREMILHLTDYSSLQLLKDAVDSVEGALVIKGEDILQ